MSETRPESTQLRVDPEVLAMLANCKSPSEPDLNAVLRRIFQLDLPESQRRLVDGAATSPPQYIEAILEALATEGGEATTATIYDRVSNLLSQELKPVDYERYDKNAVRWQTAIRTLLGKPMRDQGLVSYNGVAKTYILTDRGRRMFKTSQYGRRCEEIPGGP